MNSSILVLPYRFLVKSICFGVITIASSIALAGISAWLIIRAWQQPEVLDLTIAIVSVRGLGISRALFRYCERIYTHQAFFASLRATQCSVYQEVASSSAQEIFFASPHIASLCDVIARSVALVISPYSVAIITAIACVVVFFLMCPATGFVVLVAMIVVIVVVPFFSLRSQRNFAAGEQHHRHEFIDDIYAVIEHREELMLAGVAAELKNAASVALTHRNNYVKRSFILNAAAVALFILAIGMTVCSCIVIVAMQHVPLSDPMVGVIILLPLSAFEAASVLPLAAQHYCSWKESAARIKRLCAPVLAHRVFRCTCIRDMLCTVWADSPKVCIVIGSNGSGKTTLLLELAGLIRASEHRLSSPHQEPVVFLANSHIFTTSIKENLLLAAPEASAEQMWQALRDAQLAEKVTALPRGLDDGVADFSAGQRRALVLAQFFLSAATAKFLDEPSENLSEFHRENIYDRILTDADPAFRMIATHDADFIARARSHGYPVIDIDRCQCP